MVPTADIDKGTGWGGCRANSPARERAVLFKAARVIITGADLREEPRWGKVRRVVVDSRLIPTNNRPAGSEAATHKCPSTQLNEGTRRDRLAGNLAAPTIEGAVRAPEGASKATSRRYLVETACRSLRLAYVVGSPTDDGVTSVECTGYV